MPALKVSRKNYIVIDIMSDRGYHDVGRVLRQKSEYSFCFANLVDFRRKAKQLKIKKGHNGHAVNLSYSTFSYLTGSDSVRLFSYKL